MDPTEYAFVGLTHLIRVCAARITYILSLARGLLIGAPSV